jgi:ribosomal protein L7/L12
MPRPHRCERKPVEEGIDRAEADKLKADLEDAGATVELK